MKKYKKNAGITLIELLVVMAIFAIISSITLFEYLGFKNTSTLQNLADDIALSVRKVQGYAIGVRGYDDVFNYGYGIHFTSNDKDEYNNLGSSKSFILFMDVNANNKYDGGESCGSPTEGNECIEILSISSNDKISGLYINENTNPIDTSGSIDIWFRRPNPEPRFCYITSSDYSICDSSSNNISFVKIEVSSISNPEMHKYVIVYNNGQISAL